MSQTDVQIVVVPDAGDVVFDEDGTPMLSFTEHPEYGPGWDLSYLDDPFSPTAGVESYWIGGTIDELDWAEARAREYLWQVALDRRGERE